METPHSPAPHSPRSPTSQSPPPTTTTASNLPPSPIPLNSPLRTQPKRNLPSHLASTYPHGHLSGHPRTPSQQSALDARKREILSTMTAEQIEARYMEVTGKVNEMLQENERLEREVEGKMEKLRMQREVERRVWERVKGRRE